ncbi:NADPH-dependent FMN reductase [Agromyces mediolanus]|uniref:NADPH-dependent FMN reductase n=1 Tax=Agromyces mediolanus TaxID=41986 RepID=UPI00383546DA
MQIEPIQHEPPYRVGLFIGSLASDSINRLLATALMRLSPPEFEFHEIVYRELPLYSRDYDADYPQTARDFKASIQASDALLFVTPEYNRSLPGPLKNAIDWASRPWGQNALTGRPSAVIGASTGAIGTAVAQQSLRSILSFCNAPQMNSPEAYLQLKPGLIEPDGEVTVESTREFLTMFMGRFLEFTTRVLTVLPRPD